MSDLTVVLITGAFTILGALIGGLISKYGIPFLPKKKLTFRTGSMQEFDLINKALSGGDPIDLFESEFQDIQLTRARSRVKLKARVTFRKEDDIVASGLFEANGFATRGFGFCVYKVDDHEREKFWYGVTVLSIPDFGNDLSGVWITSDATNPGQIACGTLTFHK